MEIIFTDGGETSGRNFEELRQRTDVLEKDLGIDIVFVGIGSDSLNVKNYNKYIYLDQAPSTDDMGELILKSSLLKAKRGFLPLGDLGSQMGIIKKAGTAILPTTKFKIETGFDLAKFDKAELALLNDEIENPLIPEEDMEFFPQTLKNDIDKLKGLLEKDIEIRVASQEFPCPSVLFWQEKAEKIVIYIDPEFKKDIDNKLIGISNLHYWLGHEIGEISRPGEFKILRASFETQWDAAYKQVIQKGFIWRLGPKHGEYFEGLFRETVANYAGMRSIYNNKQSIDELIKGSEYMLSKDDFAKMFRQHGRINEIEHLLGLKKIFETMQEHGREIEYDFTLLSKPESVNAAKAILESNAIQTILSANA